MRASGGADVDFGEAAGANLGGGLRLSLFLLAEGHDLVDSLDQQEDDQRHDQEVDNSGDEFTIRDVGAVDLEH